MMEVKPGTKQMTMIICNIPGSRDCCPASNKKGWKEMPIPHQAILLSCSQTISKPSCLSISDQILLKNKVC